MAEDFAVLGIEDEIADVPVVDGDENKELELMYEVWPENVKVIRTFVAMETQWREVVVETEVIKRGLRYEALDSTLNKLKGIKRKDWPDIFQGLRVMEAAALKALREQRQNRPK